MIEKEAKQMNCKELNVVRFCLFSRALLFLLQVIFNVLIPDHNPDVFHSPDQEDVTVGDYIVDGLLSGFKRWDAQYFLHIARYGYTYENTLAFFPFYPFLIYYTAIFFETVLNYFLSFHTIILLSGVLINLLCFILSAIALHELSILVLKDKRAADLSVVLFCINPATIFFSSCYSECVFSSLTFMGMWYLEKNHITIAAALFGFSSATRSNGILSCGFVMHVEIKSLINKMQVLHGMPAEKIRVCVQWVLATSIKLTFCLLPFVLYQLYACLLYCLPKTIVLSWPNTIIQYGAEKGYKLPGEHPGKWCYQNIPFSYQYVQREYWNVGFLQYYELKQIPNFILCLPAVTIVLAAAKKYFQQNQNFCRSLGLSSYKKQREFYSNEDCFIYLVHATVLTIFGILFIHVQVITRLLACSSPVIYWISAGLISKEISKDNLPTEKSNFATWISSMIPIPNNYITWKDKTTRMILIYFSTYVMLGIAFHVNYLPWT